MLDVKVAVCDDNENIAKQVSQYLQLIEGLYEVPITLDCYYSGESFFAETNDQYYYDIIFLDIEMSGMNGIEVAKRIRKNDQSVILIYVTAHESYAKDTFVVRPFRFMTKPLVKAEFNEIFDDAFHEAVKKSGTFSFQSNKIIYNLPFTDIIYFESEARVVRIITIKHEYQCYEKLDAIEEALVDEGFLRLHQSYLVNVDYIRALNYKEAEMSNGQMVSISEKRRKHIREQFIKYHERKVRHG